jgi:predicted glycosyltransferase
VACYSHDTVGLGHTRRSIAVADSLISHWSHSDAMLITGNPQAASLPLPPRTDVVTLPTVAKDDAGHYRSRRLTAPLSQVVQMRAAVIEAAVTSFAPDLLIIDKVPLGVGRELLPTLRRLRADFDTKIILGLREILDDPVTAVAEWNRSGATEAIEEFYDAVWVYGDQRVYDPVVEYGLGPEVAARCVFTGYLGADRFAGTSMPPQDLQTTRVCSASDAPYVLCTVGGGQDGGQLASTFAATPPPDGHTGLVVCGPLMGVAARQRVHAAAAATPGMTVQDSAPDLHQLVAGAAAVVSMAGYNSVCEVLATDRPALLVPRTTPRLEQLVRARRLAELGVADLLPLDELTGSGLATWIGSAVRSPVSPARALLDLEGLHRIPMLAQSLLA